MSGAVIYPSPPDHREPSRWSVKKHMFSVGIKKALECECYEHSNGALCTRCGEHAQQMFVELAVYLNRNAIDYATTFGPS